jgi:hypothetical protein
VSAVVDAFTIRKLVEDPVVAKNVVAVALTAVRLEVEAVVKNPLVAVMPVVDALESVV